MSRTKAYLHEIEEAYAYTFYRHHPNAYQQVLNELEQHQHTHAGMADALRNADKLPSNGKQGSVQ